jgi:hypothetical protein
MLVTFHRCADGLTTEVRGEPGPGAAGGQHAPTVTVDELSLARGAATLAPEALRTAAEVRGPSGGSYWSSVGWLLDELCQVERLTELGDQAQLGLQVVDVLFLVGEDGLEDVRARDVADAAHVLDAAP